MYEIVWQDIENRCESVVTTISAGSELEALILWPESAKREIVHYADNSFDIVTPFSRYFARKVV